MQTHKFAVRLTTGLLLTTMLITPALAVQGIVNTDGNALNVRASAVDGQVLTQLQDKTTVEVVDAFEIAGQEDDWYKIAYNGIQGYVSGKYLDVVGEEDNARYVKITADALNVRTGPSTNHSKAGKLPAGKIVEVLDEANGWLHIEGGYISAEFTVPSSAEAAAAQAAAKSTASSKGQEIVDYAMGFVGSPYVYGGSSPKGFDCSGFTSYVYRHFGYKLNRSAAGQLDNGVAVSKSELQPGDLVMFKRGSSKKRASHVGLYIGGGKFVHASTAKVGVIVSSLNSDYYTTGFVGARRIVK